MRPDVFAVELHPGRPGNLHEVDLRGLARGNVLVIAPLDVRDLEADAPARRPAILVVHLQVDRLGRTQTGRQGGQGQQRQEQGSAPTGVGT